MAQKDIIFRLKIEGAGNTQALVAQTTKEIDKYEKELKQAEAGTDRFVQAQRRLANVQQALKQRGSEFNAQLQRTNRIQGQATQRAAQATQSVSGLGGAFNMATKAAAALIALQLADKVRQLGQSAILAAGEYENLAVSFDTFLGGADKAAQVLADLNRFSVETPFTPEQVNQAAKQLLAFNFTVGQTNKLLRVAGNIAAGTGTNYNELIEIIGKARVQGRLYQEDINQFSGRGVNIIGEIAKQFNVTEQEVKKLVETGRVGYPQLEKALISLATEQGKFAGLIEKQAKTLPGLLSTLEGAWNNLLRTFGEGELLNSAKSGVASLVGTINSISDAINPQAKIIQASVSELKKELALEDLGSLTKEQLSVRQSAIEAALSEERRILEVNAQAQETFLDNFNKKRIKDAKEQGNAFEDVSLTTKEIIAGILEDGTEATSREQAKQRKLVEDTQKARIASLQLALDDIKKIEETADKEQRGRVAASRADLLKLQIFRAELSKQFAEETQKAAIKRGESDINAINQIEAAERRLFDLRLQLANLSAKNDTARKLNREKGEEALRRGIEKTTDLTDKGIQAVTDSLNELRPTAEGLIQEIVNLDLAETTDELGQNIGNIPKEFEKVNESAVKLASSLDTIFDGVKFTFEELAPLAFDLFNRVSDAQEAALDRALELQRDRVTQAKEIAEEGNADVLKAERKRLAEIQDAREKAARRSEILAKAETRVQIGLAVARTVAEAAGKTGLPLASLAAGAAVAFALPALINSIPVFEDGGEIGGKPHSQGGTFINAEKGEFITNKKSSSKFMPALKAINAGKASPELINQVATGNFTNIFDMHTKPITQRLESLESAIKGIPQPDLIIDERGFQKRVSRFQRKAGRIRK